MKKIKTICSIAIVIAIGHTKSFSQSVSYSYLENDATAHNFHVALNLFNADYSSKQSIDLGYGLGISCAFKKIATADFTFDKSYAPVTDFNYHFNTKSAYSIVTTNKPARYGHIEAGGMFHISDKIKTKKRKITLSSGSSRRGMRTYSSQTYIRVPAEVRSVFAVRGGLYHYAVSISDLDQGHVKNSITGASEGGVVADDGTEFGGAVSDFDSPYYNTKAVTNLHVNGFYAGICKAQFYNVSIDADGYGKRSNRTYSRVYADAIIAQPKIDDFETTDGKSHKVSGGNAKGFETRALGARLGFEAVKMGNVAALYYKVEVGIKPGLAVHNYYLNVGFGLAFRGKLKFLG